MHWPDKGYQIFGRWISTPETVRIDLDVVVYLKDFLLTVLVEESLFLIVTVPRTDWRLERCVSLEAEYEVVDDLTFREHARTAWKPSCKPILKLSPVDVGCDIGISSLSSVQRDKIAVSLTGKLQEYEAFVHMKRSAYPQVQAMYVLGRLPKSEMGYR